MIQEYKYRVEREAEESQRKMIEANGIAAFERTVSQGISDSYLRWQGINATLALAQSPNAKIVVIGSGKDGLPIILGNVDTPTAGTTAPTGGTKPPNAMAPGASENTPERPLPSVSGIPESQQSAGGGLGSSVSPSGRNTQPVDSAAAGQGVAKPSSSSTVQDIIGSALSRIYGVVGPPQSGPASEKGMKSNP